MPVTGAAAWCNVEGTVVVAERLMSLEQIDSMIPPRGSNEACDLAPPSRAEIAYVGMLRELVERRTSPARCLGCGTLDFQYLDAPGGAPLAVVHPRCGGVVRNIGLHMVEWEAPVVYYSTEGVRLSEPSAATRAILVDLGDEDC